MFATGGVASLFDNAHQCRDIILKMSYPFYILPSILKWTAQLGNPSLQLAMQSTCIDITIINITNVLISNYVGSPK